MPVLEAAVPGAQLEARQDVREGRRQVGVSLPCVDKHGDANEFYLSLTRNAKATKRFLGERCTSEGRGEAAEDHTDKATL